MINPDSKIDVANAMKKYGGSFVRALGEALLIADSKNAQLIHDTWPEYWVRYSAFAETERRKS